MRLPSAIVLLATLTTLTVGCPDPKFSSDTADTGTECESDADCSDTGTPADTDTTPADTTTSCVMTFVAVEGMFTVETEDGYNHYMWAYGGDEIYTFQAELYILVNAASSGGLSLDYEYSNAERIDLDCDGADADECQDFATEVFILSPDCE